MKRRLFISAAIITSLYTSAYSVEKFEGDKYKPLNEVREKINISLSELKLQDSKKILKEIEYAKENQSILLEDGEYKDLEIVSLNQKGIKLIAKNPGKVLFSGRVQIVMAKDNQELNGIVFKKGGPAEKNGVIVIEGSNSIVENNMIDDFNDHEYTPNEKGEYPSYRWITLKGKNNRVVNNSFMNKTKRGTLFVVVVDETPENNIIAKNIFKNHRSGINGEMADKAMSRINGNSWEVIRVGDSKTSLLPSETEILYNLFDNMDGETEMISIKSGDNLIKGNTVKSSQSMISLRHGNNSVIEDNAIFGEGKEKTGGVRIYGENHIIRNNYIEDVRGYGDTRAGIAINTGVNDVKNNEPLSQSTKGKELNKQWTPKNIIVENNSVINSAQNIMYSNKVHKVSLSDNSSVSVVYPAVDVTFKNNFSYAEGEGNLAVIGGGEGKNPVNSKYENEVYYGAVERVEDIKNFPKTDKKPVMKKVNGVWESELESVGAKNIVVLSEKAVGANFNIR